MRRVRDAITGWDRAPAPDARASGARSGWEIEPVIEGAAIAAALVVAALGGAWLIAGAIPMGWDEAVYASHSRSLLTDIPSSTWRIYRSPGLPIIGLLGGALGFTDANLRAVAMLMNLASLAMAWALARMLWGPLGAALALLTVVGAPVVTTEIARFHTDLPAAGLLLALMALLWREFERRPEPSRFLMAAAPLAASAFYIRYGSILPIGGIGLTAILLWHRSMLARPRLIAATVLSGALLFTPHVLEAIGRTGSPLGIITTAVEAVDTSDPIATAFRYLLWLPVHLAHLLGFAVMLAGVAHATFVLRTAFGEGELTQAARRYLWLFIPAGITTIGLVLQSHPEQRYVLFPVVLAIIAGAPAVCAGLAWFRGRRALADRPPALEGAAIRALVLVGLIAGSVMAWKVLALERLGDQARWLPVVGRAIDADGDGPCVVVGSMPPIIEWYSRCAATQFGPAGASLVEAGDGDTYVLFSHIDDRRVSQSAIRHYRALIHGSMAPRILVAGVPAGVEVYRLSR